MTTQLNQFDEHFIADCWPLSVDEVLGERELAVAFDYAECDPSVGLDGGLYVYVLARAEGDAEWEDITHLLSRKEFNSFLRDAEDYVEAQAEAAL